MSGNTTDRPANPAAAGGPNANVVRAAPAGGAARPQAGKLTVVRAPLEPAGPHPHPQAKPHPGGAPAQAARKIPALPRLSNRRSLFTLLSFALCVLLPLAGVVVYFAAFAADQYVAEFRFSVTQNSQNGINQSAGGSSQSSSSSGLAAMFGGGSVSGASMQNYVVTDYLVSRQAAEELQRRLDVKQLYAKPSGDFWARFDPKQPLEKFVAYWKSMVFATYDPVTGIAAVEVRAFSADDAYDIASTMVTLAEEVVNNIAMRTQKDVVRYAESEVIRAEARVTQARKAIADFRAKEGFIDPASSAVGTNNELAKQLRLQIVQLQTDLNALGPKAIENNTPAAAMLKARITATRDQLTKVMSEIGQDREGNTSLANAMATYNQLDLDRQYAENLLINARQSLDQARASAASQQLYLTPYVRPTKPESAEGPTRILSTLMAGLGLFGIWILGLFIVRAILDHDL